ncbi:MAG: hypothetical protein ACLFQH_10430 [Halothiobacillaceae bacterium]
MKGFTIAQAPAFTPDGSLNTARLERLFAGDSGPKTGFVFLDKTSFARHREALSGPSMWRPHDPAAIASPVPTAAPGQGSAPRNGQDNVQGNSPQDGQNDGGGLPAQGLPPGLADLPARLLLDPAATLPDIAPGGRHHAAAEALLAQGGPAAAHFARVRDWALKRQAEGPADST